MTDPTVSEFFPFAADTQHKARWPLVEVTRHDIAPRQSPVDYLCLLEREREEARAMLDELQARAFDSHIRALEAELAPEPPRLPTWVVVLALAPLVALALGLAHAGRPLAALAAVLAAVATALVLR